MNHYLRIINHHIEPRKLIPNLLNSLHIGMNRVISFPDRLQIRPEFRHVEIRQIRAVLFQLKPELSGGVAADDVRQSRGGESGVDQHHHSGVVRHPGLVALTDRCGSGIVWDEFIGGFDRAVDVAEEIVSSENGGHQILPDEEIGGVQSYGQETGDGGIENVRGLREGESSHCRGGGFLSISILAPQFRV
ncbi:hypothetical protein M0R45_024916 [Rubus argutus]|uniref:Uncharacterized protein n=1 Tax=Rubus argutus TaxID=59490 RepID=A0AAW1WTW7_RUBAR